MKKMMAAVLTAVMTLCLLTGCNTSKKAAETTTENKQDTTTVDYGRGLNQDGTLEDVDASKYVTLCDYSSIQIPKKEIKVTDSEVQTQISSILSQYKTTKKITNRKVKSGDTVNIDYTGTIDGKEFDGGSATGADLTIGSNSFIDDFEDQLIGKKPGETVKVEVTFPDDYSTSDLAGKDAVFETKINYIAKEEEPELTDQFVKKNLKDSYGYTSAKDMKKKIRAALVTSKKVDYIWSYLLENCKFEEIPEQLITDRTDVLVEGLKQQASSSGYSFSDYLSAYGYENEKALREDYYSNNKKTVKVYLIADAIAKEKNLTVTDQDVEDYFDGQDSSQYEAVYSKAYVNRIVLNNMVIQLIEKTAVEK